LAKRSGRANFVSILESFSSAAFAQSANRADICGDKLTGDYQWLKKTNRSNDRLE